MGKNNNNIVQKVDEKFAKTSHRTKYKKMFYNLIAERIKGHNSINSKIVFEVILYLENFGIYTHYELENYYKVLYRDKKYFIDQLDTFLRDENNRKKIYKAIVLAYKTLNSVKGYSLNTYYKDFYDDIEALLGFKVCPKYFNFVEPAIYSETSIDDIATQFNSERMQNHNIAENTYQRDINKQTQKNMEANKRVLQAIKRAGISNA